MANQESGTAYYPQDASVDKLNIITSADTFNVRRLMVELSYYEDLYSFVVSGYVVLRDAQGIIEKLQLTGKETLEIAFGKTESGGNAVDRKFRLYSVPNRTPIGNLRSEYIKLHFCSEELLISESTKVTKAFKGKTVSEMITNIMQEEVKTKSDLFIQDSSGIYDFNIPTMKPFEAISWLSTYARPSMNKDAGADMVFYETKEGFRFDSLGTLYKRPIHKTYRYDQKNVASTFEQKITSVLDYQFVRAFDSLRDINSGTFANRLITIDPLNRTKITTDFKYSNYDGSSLNRGDVVPTVENSLGVLKLAVSNANQKRKESLSEGVGSLGEDIFLETTMPNRTAQLALANYTVIKMRIPGDTGLTAGSTITFNLQSLDINAQKQIDQYYSGKYLVTAVRHVIQSQGVFQSILEITKDSSVGEYEVSAT